MSDPPFDGTRATAWRLVESYLRTLPDAKVRVRPDGAKHRPLIVAWTGSEYEPSLRLLRDYLGILTGAAEVTIDPARDVRHRHRMDWPAPEGLFNPPPANAATGAPFGATFPVDEVVPAPAPEAEPEGPELTDFRWAGRVWALDPVQLRVARGLKDAAEDGVYEVSQARLVAIAREAGAEGVRSLREVFRGSPAWQALVIPGLKHDHYRLAPRPEDDF
jgi:hypothetical protein